MGTKRIVNDDKKIQSFLKNLKGDDEVQLPVFSRGDDGTWEFDGLTYVNTLEEYKEYKEMYGELLDFIYENFNPSIAKLYKKTLNNLIFVDDKEYNKEFVDDLNVSNGKAVSVGKILSKRQNHDLESYEDFSQQNLESIVNLVRYVQGGRKRYVPSEIIKFIKNEGIKDMSKAYLIPQLSEKGIVSKIGKDSGNIEMNFIMVSKDEAMAMKNYMLSQSNGQHDNMIENYFDECGKLTDLNESYENYMSVLTDVAIKSRYFFGLDPTNYLKKERVSSKALADSQDEIFADANGDLVGAEDETYDETQGQSYKQDGDARDIQGLEFQVNSLEMNSSYTTRTLFDNGNVAINIVTSSGVPFKVKVDGSKLKLSEGEEENDQGFSRD